MWAMYVLLHTDEHTSGSRVNELWCGLPKINRPMYKYFLDGAVLVWLSPNQTGFAHTLNPDIHLITHCLAYI